MEIAQHGRLDPAQGPRLLLRHLADQGVPILGLEGGLLGQEFVEGQAQRIDIGAGVATALESLGRHVSDRAHDVAGTGQVAVAGDLGQAEVGDPDRAVGVEQEVRRLDVAVEDAVLMGIIECLGHLETDPRHAPAYCRAVSDADVRLGGPGDVAEESSSRTIGAVAAPSGLDPASTT